MIKNIKSIIISALLVVTIPISCFAVFNYFHKIDGMRTAEEAVMLMYNFESFTTLYQEQMDKLEDIVTPEIYEEITVKNIDRALTTYLKFKQNPSTVRILETTDRYVIYTISSDSLTSGRKFVMYYSTNLFGRIDEMKEAELRDFYDTTSSTEE